MERHGKGPFIQHCNGEISYTDNMERERETGTFHDLEEALKTMGVTKHTLCQVGT
jgi:hypothetical protein